MSMSMSAIVTLGVETRPCDDPAAIARRLTKEIRMALRGETSTSAGFNRALDYPKLPGWS
jgi:hypothetical protein